MRITLSGDLGSGKSSVGRRLSEMLGIPYISTGTLFREIGQIANMDALATNLAAETNTEIDAAVDERTRELDKTVSDFIIDSRMAWHFVTNAVRVFLSVCPDTAAERIMADKTRKGEQYSDTRSAMEMLARRRQSELRRYKMLYDVNIENPANYDLWIITDDANLDDVCEIIWLFSLQKTNQPTWLPKSRIIPMIGIRQVSGIKFSTRTSITDRFELPALVARNFGLFFDDPHVLVSALTYEKSLVPYRHEDPGLLGESRDPFETARQTITASDLYDWEDAFGVELAFHRYLNEARADVV